MSRCASLWFQGAIRFEAASEPAEEASDSSAFEYDSDLDSGTESSDGFAFSDSDSEVEAPSALQKQEPKPTTNMLQHQNKLQTDAVDLEDLEALSGMHKRRREASTEGKQKPQVVGLATLRRQAAKSEALFRLLSVVDIECRDTRMVSLCLCFFGFRERRESAH